MVSNPLKKKNRETPKKKVGKPPLKKSINVIPCFVFFFYLFFFFFFFFFFVTGDRTCTSMPQHTRLFSSSPGSRQMSAVSHTGNTDSNPFYLYPCEDVCHATVSVDLSLLNLRTVLFHFCGLTQQHNTGEWDRT